MDGGITAAAGSQRGGGRRGPQQQQQQRVLADGWGAQVTGSVFCADSSLRYIYESGHQAAPSALSSLAAKAAADSKLMMGMTGAPGGKRPRENSLELPGVDLYEAEVARACTAIGKQVPALPPSFRECSVCLSANAYAQIGACGHTFHPKCFLRWFRMNRSCPLCRGPVDKVQLAQVVSVQDELEAIMAEIDDGATSSGPGGASVAGASSMDAMMVDAADPMDPSALLSHPDPLMSFLETDCFDADMDLVGLEDLAPSGVMPLPTTARPPTSSAPLGFHADAAAAMDDDSMEDDDPQAAALLAASVPPAAMHGFLMPPQPPMQFAPSSAMPNYWNVLNQGLTAPPVMPTPMPPTPQMSQRMVHIAPKPDARALQQQQQQQQQQQFQQHQHHHQHQHPHASILKPAAMSPMHPQALRQPAPLTPMGSTHSAEQKLMKPQAGATPTPPSAVAAPPPRVVSCRCTGGCRNGRCACVKEGGMCGAACRCTSCKNPFLMVKAAGADIDALLQDDCFMHNVSKTRDMVQRLQEPVTVPCCLATIKVIDCVQGYVCAPCGNHAYDFSWCMNKLLDRERTPRNHCAICKRCCDHRDVHCHDCGRCYFAGVAASLPCPCKEASHKKRREHAAGAAGKDGGAGSSADDDASEDAEGECCIM